MTNPESTQQPRPTTIALLGGIRLAGRMRLPRRLLHLSLLGGKDIERGPESSTSAQIVRVRAFGFVGGVRVRVAR
jgi:hypothetical protein